MDLDLDLPKEKDSIDLFKKTHFVLRMNIISRFEKNCLHDWKFGNRKTLFFLGYGIMSITFIGVIKTLQAPTASDRVF